MRIYQVKFSATEMYNGKYGGDLTETRNYVAKDAEHAIQKMKDSLKPYKWFDDEKKKKVLTSYAKIDPISVTLLAEA